jgi:hypothetical protein
MIVYLPLVNGKSFDEIKLRFLMVKKYFLVLFYLFFLKDFPKVMKANYLVWPFIQLTNFYFIPVQHR